MSRITLKSASATITTSTTTAVVAAIANERHHLVSFTLSVYVHGAALTGSLTDGTTVYTKQLLKDANGSFSHAYFGEYGIVCAKGAAVSFITTGTTPSVVVTVTYYTR